MKTMFTTGEAAEICTVSQQTIIRCFDSGRLKGFKVPGSKFRRIPRESLINFMKAHDIPTDRLDMGKHRVQLIGPDLQATAEAVRRDPRLEVKHASGGFEAGLQVQEFSPDVILLGKLESDAEAQAICRTVRRVPAMEQTHILLMGKRTAAQVNQLLAAGANVVIKPDTTIEQLMHHITNGGV